MKFIPEIKSAWRMLSVQIAAATIAFGLLPPDQQAGVLQFIGLPADRLPAALGILFLLGRLVSQPKVRGE